MLLTLSVSVLYVGHPVSLQVGGSSPPPHTSSYCIILRTYNLNDAFCYGTLNMAESHALSNSVHVRLIYWKKYGIHLRCAEDLLFYEGYRDIFSLHCGFTMVQNL